MRQAIRLLTLRERDILELLVAGRQYKEIAANFGLNVSTIAVHVRNAYKKLGVHSRKELCISLETINASRCPSIPERVSSVSRPSPLPKASEAGEAAVLPFRIGRLSGRQYILALDQGTNYSRAVVFNHDGQVVSSARKKTDRVVVRKGWVELDGLALCSSQTGVAAEAIAAAGLTVDQIAAVGLTNQRETALVWDRETGLPICPAIGWADCRTENACRRLRDKGLTKWIHAKTGLIPDAFFSATKIQWILKHVKGARRLAESGRLLFGTMDTWLIWNFTHGAVHVTDASNASRTMLYNIHSGEWDSDLLKLFGIPACMLPQVRSSSEVYGTMHASSFAGGVPIAGIIADEQAAMFGMRCTRPGMVKCSFGTSCFVMLNTGRKPVPSKHHLLTTIAWSINGEVVYALEGGLFVAEASLEWLRDGLGIVRKLSDIETLAVTVQDNGGVYLVPAFFGLGAPYWNRHARGTLVGLTCDSNAGHLARAVLEGIAYPTCDVLKMMSVDSQLHVADFRAHGRMTENNLLMQFQADLLGSPVRCSQMGETMALGAAYCAGLAVGFWSGQEEIDRQWMERKRFEPKMTPVQVRQLIGGWRQALKTAMFWGR